MQAAGDGTATGARPLTGGWLVLTRWMLRVLLILVFALAVLLGAIGRADAQTGPAGSGPTGSGPAGSGPAGFGKVEIQNRNDEVRLVGPGTGVFEGDTRASLGLAEVQSLPDGAFRRVDRSIYSGGFRDGAVWYRIDLRVRGAGAGAWYLLIDFPNIDRVEVYRSWELNEPVGILGDSIPLPDRLVKSRTHTLPLPDMPAGDHTIWLRATSTSTITLPAVLVPPRQYFEDEQIVHLGNGIYFGLTLIITITSLIILLDTRDWSFGFFAFHIFSQALLWASQSGLAMLYFWPTWPAFNSAVPSVAILSTVIWACAFAIKYLPLRQLAPWAIYMLGGVIAIALLILSAYFVGLLPLRDLVRIVSNLMVIAIAFPVTATLICARQGFRPGLLLMAGWVAIGASAIIGFLRNMDIIATDTFSLFGPQVLSATEMVLFGIALAWRVHQLRVEREEARQMMLTTLQRSERELEQRVEERTGALQVEVTRRQRVEADLRREKDQVEQLSQQKNRLLSIIAHDLRNAFNAIIGFADVLLKQARRDGRAQQIDAAETLLSVAENALTRMGNLLVWARSQMEGARPDLIPVMAAGLVRDGLRGVQSAADAKQVTIDQQVDPVTVLADSTMIATVLRNLLGNAVKFSRPGDVVHVEALRSGTGTVLFRVLDQGVGMSPEVRANLFRIDRQNTQQGTLGESGTGLGLVLCQTLLEQHGSGLRIETAPGSGTAVSFELNEAPAVQQ